jgi:tetratricopeptide (TPR) repeat protein
MGLFAGIAIRPRKLPLEARWGEKLGCTALALASIVLGGLWLASIFGKPTVLGRSTAGMYSQRASGLMSGGSSADALPLLDRAIESMPLDFFLYIQRAHARLRMRTELEEALQDFSRARAIEPFHSRTCYDEGVAWLSVRPEYAVIGWREFLKRRPSAASGRYGYYGQMLLNSIPFPELRQQLWSLANTVEMKLDFIKYAQTKEDFAFALSELLGRYPDLAPLEGEQRMQLFERWMQMGDRDALISAIQTNKSWERDGGWKIVAESLAQKSDFRAACELAGIYLPSLIRTVPGTSMDVQALERAFLFNPMDARLGVDLFQAYKAKGDFENAARALEKTRNSTSPPSFIDLELGALMATKGDFRRAWEYYRVVIERKKS